ncbi:MAG: HAD family hydrolase [Deltaproteobacteria bacterium]|nr:MAG: HAD family hydrolase [Deltaproteobacteria bacterium]
MRGIAVVIFDCDGVLFDSRRSNIAFYNHIRARFDLSPMNEDEEAFAHMHTADESIRYIFQGTGYEQEAQAYRMEMDYSPFVQDMVPEPHLREVLQTLKPRFGLGVATNRSATISEVLRRHGLEGMFDIVVSSLDVQKPKPHPEPLLKILRFFRSTPEQAVYVGDSPVDAQTAMAAGVLFVAYKNPELNADYHVSSLMEIVGLLTPNP